jgi:hypothetical protein
MENYAKKDKKVSEKIDERLPRIRQQKSIHFNISTFQHFNISTIQQEKEMQFL